MEANNKFTSIDQVTLANYIAARFEEHLRIDFAIENSWRHSYTNFLDIVIERDFLEFENGGGQ